MGEEARPLPRGRHGLSPEAVAADQRARLLTAAAAAFAEHGFALSSREIASAARVSSSTLYRHFENADEVLAAAFEERAAALAAEAEAAGRGVAATKVLAGFLGADAPTATLFGPSTAIAVDAIAAARCRLLERLGALLAPAAPRDRLGPLLAAAALALLADGEGGAEAGGELAALLPALPA